MPQVEAARDVPFACTCGAVHGTLHGLSKASGSQLRCHCADCRRVYLWLGQPGPAPDGVRYYQTTPDRITFDAGGDTLRAIKWKNPRLVRWIAPCCNAPLFNTLDTPKWAFASLDTARLADPDVLGPVTAYAFKPMPNGKPQTRGLMHFMPGFIRRSLIGSLTGRWRTTPFFASDGTPVATIETLTVKDRARAPLPDVAS